MPVPSPPNDDENQKRKPIGAREKPAVLAGQKNGLIIQKTANRNITGGKAVIILPSKKRLVMPLPDYAIWNGDVEVFLNALPNEPIFDLIVSSPPYNIGKSYESKKALVKYLEWQEHIIDLMIPRLKQTGSICWQVGNFVDNGQIAPLDIEFAPIFKNARPVPAQT